MKKENLISDVVKVQVGRRGIEYEGRHYWSPDLFEYFGMNVRCVFIDDIALVFMVNALRFIAAAHECKPEDFWKSEVCLTEISEETTVSRIRQILPRSQIQEPAVHKKKQKVSEQSLDTGNIESDREPSSCSRNTQNLLQKFEHVLQERENPSRKRY